MQNFDNELVLAARQIAIHAYAPYSGYTVGAAVRTERGTVFTGVNVENISYGATICAERSAIAAMVSAGERRIIRAAVATQDGGTPCGICLQSLSEFVTDPEETQIFLVTSDSVNLVMLSDLAPTMFKSEQVKRNAF